jgi:hypothetical protein
MWQWREREARLTSGNSTREIVEAFKGRRLVREREMETPWMTNTDDG